MTKPPVAITNKRPYITRHAWQYDADATASSENLLDSATVWAVLISNVSVGECCITLNALELIAPTILFLDSSVVVR